MNQIYSEIYDRLYVLNLHYKNGSSIFRYGYVLFMSPFDGLKEIEISVRAPTYREIGIKSKAPVFWNI